LLNYFTSSQEIMADSSDSRSSRDSVQNKVRDCLRDWREFVVILYSVLIWELSYYPLILGGIVSTLFLIIWYLETSVLTTLSVIGIVSAIVDYSVPILNNNFFDPSKWNSTKESKLEKICTELSKSWETIVISYNEWQRVKVSNPKIYYATLLSALLAMSWIGNLINNLFLTYLFVLSIVMFPGLKHQGIIDKYVALFAQNISKAQNKLKKT